MIFSLVYDGRQNMSNIPSDALLNDPDNLYNKDKRHFYCPLCKPDFGFDPWFDSFVHVFLRKRREMKLLKNILTRRVFTLIKTEFTPPGLSRYLGLFRPLERTFQSQLQHSLACSFSRIALKVSIRFSSDFCLFNMFKM